MIAWESNAAFGCHTGQDERTGARAYIREYGQGGCECRLNGEYLGTKPDLAAAQTFLASMVLRQPRRNDRIVR